MRLWSIHPTYLDAKGLVALWRETLLAKKVLQNRTRGYKNHPQLIRFKNQRSPLSSINAYLEEIYKESIKRNYSFDHRKIGRVGAHSPIPVSSGQIQYEFKHLLEKLKQRDQVKHLEVKEVKRIKLNPVFKRVVGPVESWEIV